MMNNFLFLLIEIKNKRQLAQGAIATLSSTILHGFLPPTLKVTFILKSFSARIHDCKHIVLKTGNYHDTFPC